MIPQITVFQGFAMLGGLLLVILVAAAGERIIKFFARLARNVVGNGDVDADIELHKALRLLHSTEVVFIFGAICMGVSFLTFLDGSGDVIHHVVNHIGWLEAVLVGSLMFQSAQLGRFVDHLMAFVQRATVDKSGGRVSERWFTFYSLFGIGILSSFLSEVAVAAAVTLPFFLVNQHQTLKTKIKLVILLAATIGIGGGLTNFAAPSIVVAAKIFEWSIADTATYLGPFVICSLFIMSGLGYLITEETTDTHKIETKQPWSIDYVNLALWGCILWFGVFNHSLIGLIATIGMSVVINFVHIFVRPPRAPDNKQHDNPVYHLSEQLLESILIFGFLAAIMFMGDMARTAIVTLAEAMPSSGMFRTLALFGITNGASALADNATAVYVLGPLATHIAVKIAIALASLIGGFLTIIGNAPNIVIVNILRSPKDMPCLRVGFVQWIGKAVFLWIILSILGAGYALTFHW